ncbi:MAG: ArnT family glycosyltransferase [Chthoniobacteraceae bacterium]
MNVEVPRSHAPSAPSFFSWPAPDLRAWVAALLFALAALGLFTRRATFPYFYHIDEPTKVEQVLSGQLNFHHPLLLLKSTRAALWATGAPRTGQAVVEMGRAVSATGAALAVGALVLLAWQMRGPAAGVIAGGFLVFNPLLFELAHYMKEDCVLLGGFMTCIAALGWYARKPSLAAAAVAGLAAGLAASGKYVGFAALALGLIPILASGRSFRGAWKAALLFTGIALAVFALINRDIFLTPDNAASGLGSEFNKIQNASEENGSLFQRKYLTGLINYVPPPLFLGTLFWFALRWGNRRAQNAFTWVLGAFPIVLILAMSFCPKVKDRYVLPAMLILGVLGAAGLAEMARGKFRHAALAAWVLGVGAVLWPLPELWQRYAEFGSDDRRELITWMREHLPADATVAADARTCLTKALQSSEAAYRFPQTVWVADKCAADLGSLEELRAWGVHYAAVSEQSYRYFLNPGKNGKADPVRQQRARFYKELFSTGRLLWERPREPLAYIHPGLRLYELPGTTGKTGGL